jgi:hypothetical protein
MRPRQYGSRICVSLVVEPRFKPRFEPARAKRRLESFFSLTNGIQLIPSRLRLRSPTGRASFSSSRFLFSSKDQEGETSRLDIYLGESCSLRTPSRMIISTANQSRVSSESPFAPYQAVGVKGRVFRNSFFGQRVHLFLEAVQLQNNELLQETSRASTLPCFFHFQR